VNDTRPRGAIRPRGCRELQCMTPHALRAGLDRLLDASIFFSFDRSGFRRHAAAFGPDDLEVDLSGRICLVTGANSGIGFETSLGLAERGATVWMLCRDRGRGEAALRELRRRTGSRRARLALLDVSDPGSVRDFAAGFAPARVDVLVHNAGVLPAERILTLDGHELTLATHVLGPWRLTQALLPRLRASTDPRVIFVSSGGMYTQRLSLADCEWQRRRYDGVLAYAQTKRMQVALARLLARDLPGGTVSAMHPGWADTPAVRSSLPRFWDAMKDRLRTPAEGADTVLWLAASEAARGRSGRFWFDRAVRSPHLLPWTRESVADRAALRAFCEKHATIRTARARAA
jgi:NAD(P)-dependent dehydrogenase (short-subunit alcohol dehydrogenase family)